MTGFATPVLLQQLLQSMEDRNAPLSQATKYAVLTLFVRLIACQSGVFSLWFSRRCYERSRGEMLTMLHAKTLSRKRFGSSAQSAVTSDDDSNNLHPSKTENRGPVRALVARVTQLIRNKRKREHKPTAPTSTGKLFNMMRCVIQSLVWK